MENTSGRRAPTGDSRNHIIQGRNGSITPAQDEALGRKYHSLFNLSG